MSVMMNGQRVGFSWNGKDGQGMVVDSAWSPDPNVARWIVAMDPDEPGGPHHLIYCAETWLTPISEEAEKPQCR